MLCPICDTKMEETQPMQPTTVVDGVEVGLALVMHWHQKARDGKSEVKETIPIGVYVCPTCGKVELQMDEKSLSKFRKYRNC